jgi:aryl-alcohol dehydrogenase-like predicted oxidoreductase
VEQLDELAAAVEIELTPEEIQQLETPYKPHPLLGHEQPTPRDF